MQIAEVESIYVNRFLLVQIRTDNGLEGLGEAGCWGYPEAAEGVLNVWRPYLIGKAPLQIEHHWQYLYRNSHFRGAAVGGALSAIDIALWDIAGKHFQVPAWQLMGGKCRDKARVYMHIRGETPEEMFNSAKGALDQGFTAVRFNPLVNGFEKMLYPDYVQRAVDIVAAAREAVGTAADVCIEIHRCLSPMEAIGLARELEQFRPFFYEDPIPPTSAKSMGEVATKINIPIATGERLHTIYEFRELLEEKACQFVRPDVCICGGITHSKKIAALAEAFHVGVIPHNPLSPVSTAACVQIAACIPNFALQEYTGEDKPPKSDMVKQPLKLEKGYLKVPETPGVGVELNREAITRYPHTLRNVSTNLHADGSVSER